MSKKGQGKKIQQQREHVENRELYQRMNFLYQAAALMTTTTFVQESTDHNTKDEKSTAKRNKSYQNIGSLGRFYLNTMRNIGKKQVLRIEPSVKRNICKRCDSLLVPGFTSRARVKSRRQKQLEIECSECKAIKIFPARKDYQLFSEKPENIVGASTNESSGESQRMT
ncbi:10467_t:CDS:2 [Ambispora gerdemannii]|uniref:10467_t:CDS:1 n=1 Tax=Ambispora gerdemannii TaxID=144530 RepID=A0A9N8Z9W6_9GLOM|nr:10467_t:CDS:2 [Ambispora gerdemannii]